MSIPSGGHPAGDGRSDVGGPWMPDNHLSKPLNWSNLDKIASNKPISNPESHLRAARSGERQPVVDDVAPAVPTASDERQTARLPTPTRTKGAQ